MDHGGRKQNNSGVHELASLSQELLDASYSGNLPLFEDVAASLDRGRGRLSVTVDSVRDELHGFGAIHMSAAGGNFHMLRFLVEDLSLEIDTLDGSGQSSLTYTICCGRVEIVPYLLEHGASPNQPCSNGFTPFHFAVTGGQPEFIQMLPASGLVEVDQTCIYGTALHLAAYAGNKDALRLLLNYGANVTIFL